MAEKTASVIVKGRLFYHCWQIKLGTNKSDNLYCFWGCRATSCCNLRTEQVMPRSVYLKAFWIALSADGGANRGIHQIESLGSKRKRHAVPESNFAFIFLHSLWSISLCFLFPVQLLVPSCFNCFFLVFSVGNCMEYIFLLVNLFLLFPVLIFLFKAIKTTLHLLLLHW